MPRIMYPATLWRGLAQEALDAATQIKDPAIKRQVLMVAARYLVLAKRAEAAQSDEEEKAARDALR